MIKKLKKGGFNALNGLGEKVGLDLPYYTKNSFWIFLKQIIVILSEILLSVIFARFTTKEVFGNYNFLIAIIAMLSIVSIPGLNTSILRSISRGYDGVYKKGVKLSFLWSLLGIPLLLLIGGYYYFFDQRIIGIGLFIASIFFPFYYAPNIWASLIQGKKRFDKLAKYTSIKSIVTTIFIVFAIFIGKGKLIPIFITYLIIYTFLNCFYYFKCKKLVKNNKKDKIWKKSGYKLTFINFIHFCYDYADKILIGIFLGPISLAIYVIAVSITGKIRTLFKELIKISYPKLFRMSKSHLRIKVKKFMPKILLISIIITTILIILIPYVIKLLYTTKYLDSIIYAQLYLLTIPFSVIMTITTISLIAVGLENLLIKIRSITIIVNIILYIILIPLLGIYGAIISSIAWLILSNVLEYHFLMRTKIHV